ncbi:hypothetical protein ACIQWZ_19970 [Streptomyces sp. NPDC098077]|uniref:hypothetical protein n=1 Tax=Streptomyces sp. NPDC098077 TaxID=3366093 RepID=UPI0038286BC1
MNVDDVVAEKVEAARRKIANDKLRREELAEARKHGIARRHAQKLARLQQQTTTPPPRTTAAERADRSDPDTRAREER